MQGQCCDKKINKTSIKVLVAINFMCSHKIHFSLDPTFPSQMSTTVTCIKNNNISSGIYWRYQSITAFPIFKTIIRHDNLQNNVFVKAIVAYQTITKFVFTCNNNRNKNVLLAHLKTGNYVLRSHSRTTGNLTCEEVMILLSLFM